MIKHGEGCAYPKCDPPISAFADSVKVLSDYKRVTAMAFGPYKGGQALYLASMGHIGNKGDEGIFRVSYNGPLYAVDDDAGNVQDDQDRATPAPPPQPDIFNRPPKAVLNVDKILGFPPLTINFDASDSFDRGSGDKGSLRYKWDFDGDGGTDPASGPVTKHTYTKSGTYFAYVTVQNEQGKEDVAEVMIEVERPPPQPLILEPNGDTGFAVGDSILLTGTTSSNVEGGPPLPDRAFTWEVRYHHGDHYHPVMEPTVGNHLEFVAPNALDLVTAQDSHLVVLLTVTDADSGLSTTAEQIISPKMAQMLFVTVPTGLSIVVDGTRYNSPITLQTWENHRFEIEAPAQRTDYYSPELQRMQSATYIWDNWSDDQPQVHEYVAHSSDAIVARFKRLTFGSDTNVVDLTSSPGTANVISRTVDGQVASAALIGIGAACALIISGLVIYITKTGKEWKGAAPGDGVECTMVSAKSEHALTNDSRPSSEHSDEFCPPSVCSDEFDEADPAISSCVVS